ncbi:hypothetical protein MHLP_03330 [Candidatus Mycoplasma haematolamae str. Purdue]|uniref:Uncharacterized protein n=1 Tax=Mycoplasma haematolamae (strain Purdue) TaxID=1212765 RepID=I7CG69_MYCHA|nr:hypothetical protein [Candidatus Mycoplasma haematolamae]AFO52246.1 hypothetical protein MHLP_03330 [Candidatus Mycoplasma haematolamae str. Purdue]
MSLSVKTKLFTSLFGLLGLNGISYSVIQSKQVASNLSPLYSDKGISINNSISEKATDSKNFTIGGSYATIGPQLRGLLNAQKELDTQEFLRILSGQQLSDDDFLKVSDLVDIGDSQNLIKDIEGESIRENKVLDIEKEQVQKYNAHTKALTEKVLNDYRTALRAIETYKQRSSEYWRFGRFTLDQRKALKKVFKKFVRLSEVRKKLLSDLSDVKSTDQDLPLATVPIEIEELKAKLIAIGWEQREHIVIPVDDSDSKNLGWDTWNNNPFKLFFKSEDDYKSKWQAFVNAMKSFKEEGHKKNLVKIFTGEMKSEEESKWNSSFRSSWYEVIKAEAEIEMTVATWMVEKMGQLTDVEILAEAK